MKIIRKKSGHSKKPAIKRSLITEIQCYRQLKSRNQVFFEFLSIKLILFFKILKDSSIAVEFLANSIKFPNFRKPNRFFFDFTRFIVDIDNYFTAQTKTLKLFRSSGMGKTLFLNVLDFYYNLEYKEYYDELFKGLSIYKHPSKYRNSMTILRLGFAKISVKNGAKIMVSEINNMINEAVSDFIRRYDIKTKVLNAKCQASLFFLGCKVKRDKRPMLILIDDYDTAVHRFFNRRDNPSEPNNRKEEDRDFINCWKKIFSVIKSLATKNPDFFIFITGISPQAVADYMEGVDIGFPVGESFKFANILGYPEEQIAEGIRQLGVPEKYQSHVLKKMVEENDVHKYFYDSSELNRSKIPIVYNPANINLHFKNMKKRIDGMMKNEHEYKSPAEFLEDLFSVDEGENIQQEQSIFKSLLEIQKIDDVLVKFIKNEEVGITENIKGPNGSSAIVTNYWDFNEPNHLLSFLFYLGVLTYASYQKSQTNACFLKLTNPSHKLAILETIKTLIERNENNVIGKAITQFWDSDNFFYLLPTFEEFFRKKMQPKDVNISVEEGMDWCIYTILKPFFGNLIQRTIIYEDDIYHEYLQIENPEKTKITLVEERFIPYKYLLKALRSTYGSLSLGLNFESKKTEDMFKIYHRIFHEGLLFPALTDVINDLNVEITIAKTNSTFNEKLSFIVHETKDRMGKFVKEKKEFKNKSVKKYLVIRCGPSRLFGYDF